MSSTFAQIETLKQQLAQVSTELAESKSRSWEAKKAFVGARLRATYYRAALALRGPAKQYSMWTAGVLTVGPATAMLLVFLLAFTVGLPGGLIFWLVILSAALAFVVLSAMLTYPSTEVLPKLIADERLFARDFKENASQLALEVNTIRKQLVATKAALRELVDADHLKRQSLLKRNWKDMRDEQWRIFVGEVFTALGAEVQAADAVSESKVDYIVTYGGLRIAAVARGSVVAITNKDVATAVAGKSAHASDRATVITNSRLANSAIEEAQATDCILIGLKEFPAFVMGSNLELFQ